MSTIEKGVAGFLLALAGIAFWNVSVSKKSNTPAVLNSAGGALSGSLLAAQGQRG